MSRFVLPHAPCLLGFALSVAICAAPAAEPAPFAKVQPLELNAVHWTSGFWAERFDSFRTDMLPSMRRLMEDNHYSQYFRNFEIAAGLAEGDYRGASFNDGDFYKLLEAECATYAVTRDAALDEHLDRVIAVIAKAQRADGYLHTPVLIGERKGDPKAVPFRDRNNFEVYNMGHLMTTACVHHRATGKTSLLAVATKAADFLAKSFANPTPEQARNSICPSHYMGMIDLYRETGEPRYLEAAKGFFAMRDLVAKSDDGGDDNQDRIPFLKQDEAVGHAVRANYLFAGAADLFAETGDPATWQMLERVWKNVVQEKLYLTGACGALYDGASPDGSKDQKHITRIHQAYGRNYQLPNTTAHTETCANIGNVLWNWRMFLASGEARFMDVLELALYNSVLSGVSLDGTNFFYTNPLRVTDPMPVNLRWSRTRVPYREFLLLPAERRPHHCRSRHLRLRAVAAHAVGEPLRRQHRGDHARRHRPGETDAGNRVSVERPGAHHGERNRGRRVHLEAAHPGMVGRSASVDQPTRGSPRSPARFLRGHHAPVETGRRPRTRFADGAAPDRGESAGRGDPEPARGQTRPDRLLPGIRRPAGGRSRRRGEPAAGHPT